MFIQDRFKAKYVDLRMRFDSNRGDRLLTFSSARKRMSVVLCNSGTARARGGVVYTKGASEMVLALATHYIDADGKESPLDVKTKASVNAAIDSMARNALRTVAVAHKTMSRIKGDESPDDLESGLVLDAVFGIKDPLRPDVPDAVRRCHEAGIFVRMVTGDNVETAKAIARECGILTEGGLAMEGPDFRKLSPKALDEILPYLQVLARSSPEDKHTLVTRLNGAALPETKEQWLALHPGESWETRREYILPGYKEEWRQNRLRGVGEVVGVTGDGTNDGPALKAADVGLAMGMSGTDVAKEASDIIILDDNFSSIVKSVMWGRAVFDNIRKFLQFQLTVNVVALTITFISALTGKEPPLNAVMMLWVNLIMDTMGALALGTEPPSPTLLKRRPYRRDASLISNKMLRNISVQFLFQLGLLWYLLLPLGAVHFGVEEESTAHLTVVFNTFVFCQVFNEINARSIGDDLDVLHGLNRNQLFVGILAFTAVAQYFIVEFGGEFVRTAPLSKEQWLKCILLGALSLPVGGLMRLIPAGENKENFADLSPLIQKNYKRAEEASEADRRAGRDKEGSGFSLSFFIWLLLVAIIPAATFNHFEEHWTPLAHNLRDMVLAAIASK